MAYTEPTLKRLFALSGNICAFPSCTNPIVDASYGVVVGEICHIEGRKPGSARYNASQTPEERDAFESLVLMCSMHHTIVDAATTRDQYPVALLQQYKREHESNNQNAVVNEGALQAFVTQVIKLEGSIIVTVGQSGGQVAHTITNIIGHDATRKEAPTLVPEIDSHMVKADNGVGVDFYDFRVRLRNEGSSTVREFRVEVEIPDEFLQYSGASYTMEVQNHNRPGVRLFRATEKHWPGTVIYPDSLSDFQISLDYQVPVARYTNITKNETIRVKVSANDAPVNVTDYVIADYLSEDRCNQLWAPGRERPEALRHPRKFFPQRQGS